jgi:hypothetical protein
LLVYLIVAANTKLCAGLETGGGKKHKGVVVVVHYMSISSEAALLQPAPTILHLLLAGTFTHAGKREREERARAFTNEFRLDKLLGWVCVYIRTRRQQQTQHKQFRKKQKNVSTDTISDVIPPAAR